jgi:hypothetical protein
MGCAAAPGRCPENSHVVLRNVLSVLSLYWEGNAYGKSLEIRKEYFLRFDNKRSLNKSFPKSLQSSRKTVFYPITTAMTAGLQL